MSRNIVRQHAPLRERIELFWKDNVFFDFQMNGVISHMLNL